MSRATVVLIALALILSACRAVDNAGGPDAGSPETAGPSAPGFSDSGTTSVTGTGSLPADPPQTEPEVTTPGTNTTSRPPAEGAPSDRRAGEVEVYLLIDDPTAGGPSPSLIPVARPLAVLSSRPIDLPRIALGFLLAGPTPSEREGGSITTAIPDGTRLVDLVVEDRVATVDLSAEFEAGSGSFAEIARLEQVAYTLTRFDDIDGVVFEIEGRPVSVFGGHGIVLDGPVGRTDVDTTLPSILIESPAHWSYAASPLEVSGTAETGDGMVHLALRDGEGSILWEGSTPVECGRGCRGEFTTTITYELGEAQVGSIAAWENASEGGPRINLRQHTIFLAG